MENLDKKNYLALTMVLITSFGLFYFGICPLFIKIKTNSEQLFRARQETASLKTKTSQASTFKQILKQQEPDLLMIQKALVTKTPVVFFQFLENLAKKNEVLLDISLSPIADKKNEMFDFLNIQLSFQGSFNNCLKFLQQLETSPYLFKKENFLFHKAEEEEIKKAAEQGFLGAEAKANLSIKLFINDEKD